MKNLKLLIALVVFTTSCFSQQSNESGIEKRLRDSPPASNLVEVHRGYGEVSVQEYSADEEAIRDRYIPTKGTSALSPEDEKKVLEWIRKHPQKAKNIIENSIPKLSKNDPNFSVTDADNYGWNKRISFIAGAGASVTLNPLYHDPVIDRSTNFVQIERATIVKPSMTLGIVYTPKVSTIRREITVLNKNGDLRYKNSLDYYPRGFSVALFINPVSLLNVGSSNISNSIDVGYGLGWRAGSFSIFLTNEFFAVRQPRSNFINQYKGNDKPYVINGQTQNSIDVNDASIFKTDVGISLGLKICYTFDIIKSYHSTWNSIKASQPSENTN